MGEVNTKAPGKLYVAGEYAVVEPGHSAILTAVNLFIHLKISESEEPFGTIYSEGFTEKPVKWQRNKKQIQLEPTDSALKYIISAIQTTENYLVELGVALKNYDVQIKSELDNETGNKLGLGSSGAVTVAAVRGLLKFYAVYFTDELVYKLSVVAQIQLGVNSSFGDLAAITYTGWIKYTSFKRTTVLAFLKKHSIKETIDLDWPYLDIERLDVPAEVSFLIGWTGRPASSDQLVGEVQANKKQSLQQYNAFLHESKKAVEKLAAALPQQDNEEITTAVNKNRIALNKMGQETNVLIETPQLTKLCDIAQKYDGVAKTSGAGGGDSGIAFIFNKEHIQAVISEWQAEDIINLPQAIYKKSIHK